MIEQSNKLPGFLETALSMADPSWHDCLRAGLQSMLAEQPNYFSDLAKRSFFPTENRMFAAFSLPISSVHYVLLGEGPYPRAESATGVCFMDGAVKSLWQPGIGLSKQVNRATSLRNFIKMVLVAEGALDISNTTTGALKQVSEIACAPNSGWIQTGAELQANLLKQGFLLLNASLVFRDDIAPAQDANAWLPFLRAVLKALARMNNSGENSGVKLILWGKLAEKVMKIPESSHFLVLISEHPYNLSFIANSTMQNLFKNLHLFKQNY